MDRERLNKRGCAVNTAIAGHCGVRNGKVHTGAAALMLGAALAMNVARAGDNDVDRDDTVARPAPPAPAPLPAPASGAAARAFPAPPAPAAAPASPAPPAHARTDSDSADLDTRLREAQERMSRAAAEYGALAQERAAQAIENLPFGDPYSARRTV